jgi:hypothetical protein
MISRDYHEQVTKKYLLIDDSVTVGCYVVTWVSHAEAAHKCTTEGEKEEKGVREKRGREGVKDLITLDSVQDSENRGAQVIGFGHIFGLPGSLGSVLIPSRRRKSSRNSGWPNGSRRSWRARFAPLKRYESGLGSNCSRALCRTGFAIERGSKGRSVPHRGALVHATRVIDRDARLKTGAHRILPT